MLYGVPARPSFDEKYWNDTEKDLTLNWTACFGEREAVDKYQETGEITTDASKGMGICHPVKKTDLLKIRPDLEGQNLWTTHWTPKKEIPKWIPDPEVKKVFVVCTNDEPTTKGDVIKNAISFLQKIA